MGRLNKTRLKSLLNNKKLRSKQFSSINTMKTTMKRQKGFSVDISNGFSSAVTALKALLILDSDNVDKKACFLDGSSDDADHDTYEDKRWCKKFENIQTKHITGNIRQMFWCGFGLTEVFACFALFVLLFCWLISYFSM